MGFGKCIYRSHVLLLFEMFTKMSDTGTGAAISYSTQCILILFYRPPPRPWAPCRPPYEFRCCAALAGFKIWNEHISVSSTVIIAPALSNSPQ